MDSDGSAKITREQKLAKINHHYPLNSYPHQTLESSGPTPTDILKSLWEVCPLCEPHLTHNSTTCMVVSHPSTGAWDAVSAFVGQVNVRPVCVRASLWLGRKWIGNGRGGAIGDRGWSTGSCIGGWDTIGWSGTPCTGEIGISEHGCSGADG